MMKLGSQEDRLVRLPVGLWLAFGLLFACLLLVHSFAQSASPGTDRSAGSGGDSAGAADGDFWNTAQEITHTAYLPYVTANRQTPTEVFTLGILGPFTGPSASTGAEFLSSVTMALEAIDWQIGHYRIQPVWIDSRSDPAHAAQAYEQAILQAGVQAGVLGWHSSVAFSCMDVTAEYGVPHFFGLAATDAINIKFASDPARYGYWTTKGWPSPAKLSISYLEAIEFAIDSGAWNPLTKTLAIYGEDTDWGRSFGNAIQGKFEAAGWATVAEEYFPIDQTDFYTLVHEFNSLSPTVVAGTSTALPAFSAFLKQADEVGLQGLIIAEGLHWFSGWYALTGEASNYLLDQAWLWQTSEAEAFAADFEARWGYAPHPDAAGLAYDGARLFLAAARAVYQETGILSSEALYAFAQREIWTGQWAFDDGVMMERYQYLPETIPDPVVGAGFYLFPVVQLFDGEDVIIYPPAWADQPLTPPPGNR